MNIVCKVILVRCSVYFVFLLLILQLIVTLTKFGVCVMRYVLYAYVSYCSISRVLSAAIGRNTLPAVRELLESIFLTCFLYNLVLYDFVKWTCYKRTSCRIMCACYPLRSEETENHGVHQAAWYVLRCHACTTVLLRV